MFCQSCGQIAPTKNVTLRQNIGALVMRFSKTVSGNLCKSCIRSHFWSLTMTTLFLGWWGVISFICTPFFIINNLISVFRSFGMPGQEVIDRSPELTPDAVEPISPHAGELFQRMGRGDASEMTAQAIAQQAGVDPGQVYRFAGAVIAAQNHPS